MKCPKCNSDLRVENLNIQTDVGLCDACSMVFKISDLLVEQVDDAFDMNQPVDGAWLQTERQQLIIGASTRSAIAFFLVPFMLVWTGGSLGGIYGYQIMSGEFNLMISLFGIPFVLGAVLFWKYTLLAIWGKVQLELDRFGGTVFTGIGNIGSRKKFTWEEISSIREVSSSYKNRGNVTTEIVLEGKKRISFGAGLSNNRRYYLFASLKNIQSMVKSNKRFV